MYPPLVEIRKGNNGAMLGSPATVQVMRRRDVQFAVTPPGVIFEARDARAC